MRDARLRRSAAGPETRAGQLWRRAALAVASPLSYSVVFHIEGANNEHAPDDGAVGAYGENLERLRRVKAAYDPDDLFRSNRNISPAQAREARGPSEAGARTP